MKALTKCPHEEITRSGPLNVQTRGLLSAEKVENKVDSITDSRRNSGAETMRTKGHDSKGNINCPGRDSKKKKGRRKKRNSLQ